jgi:hypothetical protein
MISIVVLVFAVVVALDGATTSEGLEGGWKQTGGNPDPGPLNMREKGE